MRVGTFVLNTGFYRPALLGRDVTDTDRLTGGRLELGLGTGYNPAEFDAVGLPFPTGGARVDHLADMVTRLRGLVDPMPPLLLAGSGPRLLRLAARHADIVGFTITDPVQSLADRVELVRAEAGDRFDSLELNLFVVGVTVGTEPDLTIPRQLRPTLTDDQIRSLPGMLFGSAQRIAETVLRYRETMGISYFVVLEPAMTDFAKVMACLR